MTRIVVLLAVVTLLPTLSLAQLDRDAMERERMKANNVKVAEQYAHKFKRGAPQEEGYLVTRTTYDKSGNPLTVVNYRANGDESSRLYYAYDDQGQRVEYRKEEPTTDENGHTQMRIFFRQKFTYDSKGRKKTESGFDGVSNYRVIYNYLPNGKLSNITRYNSDNTVGERWTYTYNGNKQTIHVTPRRGEPYSVEKSYNGQGQLLSDVQFGSDAKELRRLEYTYTSSGQVATESESYAGNLRYRLRYVFDKQNRLTQIYQRQTAGPEIENNNYKYDDRGNLIEEHWVDGDPSLVSQKESEFNPAGDMVKVQSYYAPYRYRVMYTYKYERF